MSRPTFLVPLIAFAFACTGTVPTPAQPWNQTAVTALAEQLTTASEALFHLTQDDPQANEPGQELGTDSIAVSARKIHEDAEALYGDLKSGKGRDETRDQFFDIKEISDDIGEASYWAQSASDASKAKSSLDGVLGQLAAFYGPE